MHNEGEHENVTEGMHSPSSPTPPEKDESTKHAIYLSIVFASLLIVAVSFWYAMQGDRPSEQKQVRAPTTLVEEKKIEKCVFEDDGTAKFQAITDSDMDICTCIEDVEMRNECKDTVSNALLYRNAINQMDPTKCDEITVEAHREACRGMITSAVGYFETEDPQHLALTYARAHNENAIASLEALLESDPEDTINLLSLALSYAEKGLREQEQGRSQTPFVEKALALVERAKALDENSAEVYRVEGYVYEIKPDLSKAMLLYDRAIELDPNNILAYSGRGHVRRMMGILQGAVDDFHRAAELDGNREHPHIYTNLCNLEHSRGDVDASRKNCTIVVEMQEASPVLKSEALQILAVIATDEGSYTQASAHLRTAQTYTPRDPNLFVTLARLNLFQGDYTESESNARRAIELSPTKATALLALAQAHYMQMRYEEAIQVANQGVGLVQDDVSLLTPSKPAVLRDLYYTISFCHRELGNTQKQQEFEQKAEEAFNSSID